ncbi:Uncharacterised protein [Candidatus Gugararchaeum adminiculabundum]|nr:Uncharacterised protein [Candidatus Gugararchaeum adminiculabundum]
MEVRHVKIEFEESDTQKENGKRWTIYVERKTRGLTVKPVSGETPYISVRGKKVAVEDIY